MVTVTPEQTEVGEEAVTALKASLRGRLLQPGDEGYDEARAVWNGMIDKHPTFIAHCAGVADVISAVNFARTNRLTVAVRCGGHNWAGLGVADSGILIDLSPMKGIRVDPAARTVTAEGGVTWGEFDHECAAFGLATTGGHITTTGIAGLTLGGGIGWLVRKYSLASDNLLSVDLVTADGQLVTASETQNPDLFWGLRGGGGNFGVATSLTYQLHPLGTTVIGGAAFFPASRAAEVLRFTRDYLGNAPDELTTVIAFITAPPAPFLPEHLHGTPVIGFAVCYAGDIEEGMRVVQPIRDLGPDADVIGPMPYTAHQGLFDWAFPRGNRYYIKSQFVQELTDDFIAAWNAHATDPSSPLTWSTIQHYGGAVARKPADATAYGHRDGQYTLTMGPAWTDPTEDDMHVAWARSFFAAMQPFAHGVYVNFLGEGDTDRVPAAYDPRIYARLRALKKKYDPTNLFHVNHNIQPAD